MRNVNYVLRDWLPGCLRHQQRPHGTFPQSNSEETRLEQEIAADKTFTKQLHSMNSSFIYHSSSTFMYCGKRLESRNGWPSRRDTLACFSFITKILVVNFHSSRKYFPGGRFEAFLGAGQKVAPGGLQEAVLKHFWPHAKK